jgi:hypothetical protein
MEITRVAKSAETDDRDITTEELWGMNFLDGLDDTLLKNLRN